MGRIGRMHMRRRDMVAVGGHTVRPKVDDVPILTYVSRLNLRALLSQGVNVDFMNEVTTEILGPSEDPGHGEGLEQRRHRLSIDSRG